MRKFIVTILFILLFTLTALYAQEESNKKSKSENLDPRKVLMQQIEQAKQKEANNIGQRPASSEAISSKESPREVGLLKILFFIAEGSLLYFLYVFWNRSRFKRIKMEQNRFKRQVQKIRQEKIGSPPGIYLSNIRKGLDFFPASLENTGKEITLHAKKNSLSKGELHLAAKLKLLMNTQK